MTKPKKAAVQAPERPSARPPGNPHLGRLNSRTPAHPLLALCVLLVGLTAAFLAARRVRRAAPTAPAAAPATLTLPVSPEEQALHTAMAGRPNEPAPHEALARYLLEQHRPFEALWQFRLLQDLQPDSPDAELGIARALIGAGLPGEAIRLLSARPGLSAPRGRPSSTTGSSDTGAAHPTPGNAERDRAMAEAALATARPTAALRALADAGAVLATSAPAELLLGDARAAAGDAPGAEAAYRRAVALAPVSAAGYDRLGRLALSARQWAAARQAFSAARERAPQAPGPLYRLGLAAMGAGDPAAAERLWLAAAAVAPNYAPAQTALGRLSADRKQWSASATHLAVAVKADPSSEAQLTLAAVMAAEGDQASACYQRGFYDLATDRPQQALAEFRQMERLAPDRVDGPLVLGLTEIQMKRLDLAAGEARRGLARHPHDPRLLERLAELHTIGHNWRQVRQLCEEWLRFDPGAAEPSLLLEQIAREEQRLPDALRLGEQALAREPENAAACFQMSKTLSLLPGTANQRRALDLARAAAYRNPREADYWHQFGVLLRSAGQPEAAADAWLHALELNPVAPEPCRLLAQIAAQERRPASARFFADLAAALQERARTGDVLWRAAYNSPQNAAAHTRLAQFLLAQGDPRRARYQLEQAVALDPADRASRRTLGVIERLRALQEE